jgi:hypothetical protein
MLAAADFMHHMGCILRSVQQHEYAPLATFWYRELGKFKVMTYPLAADI